MTVHLMQKGAEITWCDLRVPISLPPGDTAMVVAAADEFMRGDHCVICGKNYRVASWKNTAPALGRCQKCDRSTYLVGGVCSSCANIDDAVAATTQEFNEKFDANSKPTNPKDCIGTNKLPLHLCTPTVTAYHAMGQLEGLLKYGRTNWRAGGVRASIYVDACLRHLFAWFEGEENASDSGLPHLAHALACIGIIVDAKAEGKLVDDRAFSHGGYAKIVEQFTPEVARLREKYKDRKPKHWTRSDGKDASNV